MSMIVSKVQYVVQVMALPVALMMGFPVFLFQIVLEKEKKLIEYMKINGLRITNYWLIQFFFNYFLYLIVIAFYVFCGTYIFKF